MNDENRNWNGSFNNSMHDSYTQNQAGVNWGDSVVTADQKVWEYENNQRRIQEENNKLWQQPVNNNYQYDSSFTGSYRGGGTPSSSSSTSFSLGWISSLFYFFFWFIPKLFFYYMPIKHFFKFLLFAVFAAAAYGLSSDSAKQMGSDVQWALQPQNISYKPSEYYGVSPKYLKKYRKLSARGLINASGGFSRNHSQDAAFYAVLKERLLADPNFFNLQSSEGIDYTTSTCKQARRYFTVARNANPNTTREQRVSLYLEEGYFNFMKTCAGSGYTTPASSFINHMSMLRTEPNVKPDYDRIYQDTGFQLSHYREKAAYILYALAFILFSMIIIKSHRLDCEKRAADKLAKDEAEKATNEAKKTTEKTEEAAVANTVDG